MISKFAASIKLKISSKKLQRLCFVHREELEQLGYIPSSKFITAHQFHLIEHKLNLEEQMKYERFAKIISKSTIAGKMGISRKTLSNWLHMPKIYNRLTSIGYKKTNKKLTREQFTVVKEHLGV